MQLASRENSAETKFNRGKANLGKHLTGMLWVCGFCIWPFKVSSNSIFYLSKVKCKLLFIAHPLFISLKRKMKSIFYKEKNTKRDTSY